MPNDYKIENKAFWYEPLDNYQLFDEIVVMEISEKDLLAENPDPLNRYFPFKLKTIN